MAARKADATVFDEMLTYLCEPMVQIPVNSFMDENCLIFDIDTPTVKEHHDIYDEYKNLIFLLLDAFCSESDISVDEAKKGIRRLNKIPDLRDIFNVYFEQIIAADDFKLFSMMMAKRNILIQEQVIAMILAATGILPESLTRGMRHQKHEKLVSMRNEDKLEKEVMADVIRNSKANNEGDAQLDDASGVDVKELEANQKLLNEKLKKLDLQKEQLLAKTTSESPKNELGRTEDLEPFSEPVVSSELDPEEMRRRQEFLRQQRDKLLNMKKEAREKQLKNSESNLPSVQPTSSKNDKAISSKTAEDGKKLALRRSIADKLRQEVIKKH